MREGINDPYAQYLKLGGIINREDYENTLHGEMETNKKSEEFMLAAENMARRAGIELKNGKDSPDPRAKLFVLLRSYQKPGETNHHGQMGDPQLFAEALRMSDDADSLEKLKLAYHKPGIFCPLCQEVATPENNCK